MTETAQQQDSLKKSAERSNSSPSNTTKTPAPASKKPSSVEPKTIEASQAHFILQGKGGVGKSLVSSLLAQFFIAQNYPVRGIDTDPINQTFANLPFVDSIAETVTDTQSNETNHRTIDRIMGEILEKPSVYVIDNGASSFIPMSVYLIDGGGIVTLAEEGTKPIIHLVIPVGPETEMALEGCMSLIDSIDGALPVVLWINEREDSWEHYFGGKFEDNELFKSIEEKVTGFVTIPHMKAPLSLNFSDMLRNKQSFAEVSTSKDWLFMEKARMKRLNETIFGNIESTLRSVI